MANSSQQFYKLQADPFRLGPDHHFSFPHKTYKKALADLKLSLVGKAAFIVITGRPGTGKTTLLSEAIAQLDASKVVMANLLTTRFGAHDLRSMVAASFGLNCSKIPNSDISSDLENFLQMRHSEGKRAFLVIDDAQRLGEGVLEELQLLTNLQEYGKPLLQIILVGPEELTDSIHSLEPEDTSKRVISSSQLEPLSESETIDYIAHRLNHAGWEGDPEITKGAAFLAHHFSGGIPGILNRICSRFLLYGCAEKKHQLNADDMKSVLEELSDEQLVTINTAVIPDLEEKINILENEFIQPLKRIKKTSIETFITRNDDSIVQLDTNHQDSVNAVPHIEAPLTRQEDNPAIKTSEPAVHPGVFNNPASTTDESADNVPAENNSRGDTRHSHDESRIHTETAAIDSPLPPGERSRWPGNYAWLAVPVAVVIAVGLKIYSGAPQVHTQIQPQADIVSRSPAYQIQRAENTQLDEAATGTGKTSTTAAVEPGEPRQVEIHELATDTAPVLTEKTPELIPARTVKTAPPVIAKPAEPAGENPSAAETKTATGSLPQPLKTTTAPDLSAEPVETTQVAVSEKSVPPVKAEPAAIDRSRATPVKQASPLPARSSPGVKETTGTLALAKADPVIIQPEKSSKPAAKKPENARGTSTSTGTAGSASQTMNTLLANQWVTGTRQQAAQLPSFITNCSEKRGSIECWSREHFIEKNEKSVGVKTKSYLKDFTKSGFTIKYKHMLLEGANEKRRWEDRTHQLDCVITYGNKIKCIEDGGNGAVIFTRNTSDQPGNRANF